MNRTLPSLGPPDVPMDRARLDASGFAWWEALLLDEQRNGVLLWWGYGLPEARLSDEHEVPARAAPSLAVLVIAGARPAFWLHQRHAEGDAAWEEPAGRWRFGRSQIETLRDLRAQVVIARIDCDLPGTKHRLEGHVEMGGVPRRASADTERAEDEWAPLMGPGEGRAILSVGRDARFHLQGRAYHQRHGREAPLDDDVTFLWGHAAFPEHTRSYQVRISREGGLRARGTLVAVDGRTELAPELDVELTGASDDWSMLTLRSRGEAWLQVTRDERVMAREAAITSSTQNRAPLALPVCGLVHEVSGAGLHDASTRRRARDFLHLASGHNPHRVRITSGTQHRRWRRALPFG